MGFLRLRAFSWGRDLGIVRHQAPRSGGAVFLLGFKVLAMKYYIFEGFDWVNARPVFQVNGRDNDYCGEWHASKPEAQAELDGLVKSSQAAV